MSIDWQGTEGKGAPLKTGLNQIREELDSKSGVVGRTIPADCVVIATGDLIYGTWYSACQSEVSTIIPMYLATDGSGVNWTEATLLAYIGDPSRIDAPVDPIISAAWMFQQINMLNELIYPNP